MERKTQTGYRILADISGYTSCIAQTGHAGITLSYLLETIVEKLNDLLTIAKLEGDAVMGKQIAPSVGWNCVTLKG